MKKIYPHAKFQERPRKKRLRFSLLLCLPLLILLPLKFFGQDFSLASAAPTVSPAPNSALSHVTVEQIYISGNSRTKPEIILRELDFSIGDTISIASLAARLEQNEYKLMNTGLFTSALINFKEWEAATNDVGLQITVREDWYIFPFPILELADRNFNVWWEEYDRSLRRLNLGVRFYHTNFTGRKDLLKAVLQFGFTKKYELNYTVPFFNKKRTLGLNLNFLHTREKETGYNTVDNRLLFHRNDEEVLLQRFRAGAGLIYRRRLDVYHQWDLTFYHNIIHESIQKDLNPDFFLGDRHQQYGAFSYTFTLDKRDIKPYPMHGYLVSASASKKGFGFKDDVNALDLSVTLGKYFTLSERWSAALTLKGKTGLLRQKQPYYNSFALGYEPDFLRGYELYVIDGMDYAYYKSSLRFQLFKGNFNWGKYSLVDELTQMPVKLFLSFHNDLGYVNNPFYRTGNPLSNELLWGAGIGLDLVLYYDKIFNFEVSRNHLNEYGFYLHWTFSF